MSAKTLITLLPALARKIGSSKTSSTALDASRQANSSLVEFTRDMRAEFVTLLDQELDHQPYIGDILQNALSLCSAYYLQAAAIQTSVSGVKITQRLNKINPNRGGSVGGTVKALSMETYHHDLPNYLSLEDNSQSVSVVKPGKPNAYAGANARYGDGIRAYDSMLVGKNLEVTISENGQNVVVPVNVRLTCLGAGGDEIVDVLGLASSQNTDKERRYRWSIGQLQFIRDMVMCDDLINLHRKTLLTEKSGFYNATLERRRQNRLAAIASGEASAAAASNIIIISGNTARKLEAKLGGKLSNQAVREEIFATTSTMLLFVVDTKWEQVTLYTKSLGLPTELSIRNLKVANKDGGEGILEAMQKLMMGKAL